MKTIRLAIASLAAFLFNACGDDSPSVNINTGHASCTVYSESEDSYAIECPDGTKVTIRDGIDGVDGKDGEDGADGKDGKDGQNGKAVFLISPINKAELFTIQHAQGTLESVSPL